jgi:hypothetical protein
MKIEITREKSEEMALLITMINNYAEQLDFEYLFEGARQTRAQAERYDATAPLNRMWSEHGSKLLNLKADALDALAKFCKSSIEISALEKVKAHSDDLSERFSKQFMV